MKNKKGFTIIEVSLVLAIGGLILMMVFIALPTLQRNQRDAKRREDVLLLLENIKKYQQDNRGALPSVADDLAGYNGNSFTDPSGGDYGVKIVACEGGVDGGLCKDETNNEITTLQGLGPSSGGRTMLVITQARCNGQEVVASSNPRRVAIIYKLEVAGVSCANT